MVEYSANILNYINLEMNSMEAEVEKWYKNRNGSGRRHYPGKIVLNVRKEAVYGSKGRKLPVYEPA